MVKGNKVWEVDTAQRFNVQQNFFGVGSNPVIYNDLLIVMIGGSPPDLRLPFGGLDVAKGNGTGIVAFDKRTGKTRYSITDELASYASLKLAKIGERDWCFAFARSGLVGFDPTTGKIDFQYPWRAISLESVNASVPVVVGEQVFISETYGPGASLLNVRPGASEVVWKDDNRIREKSFQAHWNTPIYRNGYLYGCSGRHEYSAVLRCIEWKTGKVQWELPGLNRTSLMYVDQHFVCQGEDGVVRLIKVNPEKYEEVALIELQEKVIGRLPQPLLKKPCWAAPILSHGLMYLRGKDRLVCVELIPEKK
jgi:outer membrane protein assembly factor BamB